MARDHVDVANRSGLPCRARGCDFFISMTDLARRDKLAFAVLCKVRIDHEQVAHGYVHEQVRVTKARYDWGTAKRQVMPGQGW
jgi:hypothetical protein